MRARTLIGMGVALACALAAVAAQADPGAGATLARTAAVAGCAAAFALALGLALALVVGPASFPGRRLVLALGVAPLVIPPYLAAVSWIDLFGPAGVLPTWLGVARGAGPSLVADSWIYSPLGCGLLLGACWSPLVLLAAVAALGRVPREALDAARLARGLSGARGFLLRAALGDAAAGALVVFALAACEFAVPQLLRVKVQAEEVYFRMDAAADPTAALRAALPLLALGPGAAWLALGVWRRRSIGGAAGGARARRRLGPAASALTLALSALLLAPGLWVPVWGLGERLSRGPAARVPTPRAAAGGARANEGSAGPPTAFAKVQRALTLGLDVGAGDARRSAAVGGATATLALLLGGAAAWPLRRARGAPVAAAALALVALATLPPPLIGVGLLSGLNREPLAPLLDSLAVVVLGCTLRFAPLAALIAWSALRAVPSDQEAAARLAGRRPGARVVLPQVIPSLVAAWSLVYVLSVTEFGASALLAPPGKSLLSVFVVNEAHYGQGAELAGLCALLLGVALAPLLPLAALAAWAARARGAGAAPRARGASS